MRFGGEVKASREWVHSEGVMAVAYDTPIPGYNNDTVNTMRLWSAKAVEQFNNTSFFMLYLIVSMRERSCLSNQFSINQLRV